MWNSHLPGLSGKEVIELIEGDFDDRSIYNQLSRMESKRLISCKPAPGDKRYKIYSLPNCQKDDELRNVNETFKKKRKRKKQKKKKRREKK